MKKVRNQEYAFSPDHRLEPEEIYTGAEFTHTGGSNPDIHNVYHEHCGNGNNPERENELIYNGRLILTPSMRSHSSVVKEITIIAKNDDIRPICAALFKIGANVSNLRRLNKLYFEISEYEDPLEYATN